MHHTAYPERGSSTIIYLFLSFNNDNVSIDLQVCFKHLKNKDIPFIYYKSVINYPFHSIPYREIFKFSIPSVEKTL